MLADRPHRLDALFARIAVQHAARIALDIPPSSTRDRRIRLSYAELANRAEQVANRVLEVVALSAIEAHDVESRPAETAGTGPSSAQSSTPDDDALIAIFLTRENAWLYAAQLGIWRAGMAFTCLEPRFPDGHLSAVLEEADPVAIVTDPAGAQRLASLFAAEAKPRLIVLDELEPGVLSSTTDAIGTASNSSDPLPYRASPSNTVHSDDRRLAYVIYTSGTTGRPKGVMIEHRSIFNLAEADRQAFGLGPGDRVAQISSPAYDSSVEETWLAFAAGATLVPVDDDTVRLGPDLVPWLRDERINVLGPPPTLLRTMACGDPAAELPDLKLLYVGGEALPQDLADLWAPGRRMENGYGPTECTVTVVRGPVAKGQPVTIGRPVPGHQAWLVDEQLNPVADGEEGELVIAGIGLARGYHRRPELTAERFVQHAVLGRIYRTGDLARRNPDGDLEYLGRLDGQVKLRGYRVELGAIEACLAEQPGVRAAACAIRGEGRRQTLVAFVVPRDEANPPETDALRLAVRQALPEYMVPSRIEIINRLPTTVGGKLDRRALPGLVENPRSGPIQRGNPNGHRPSHDRSWESDRGPGDKTLTEVIAEAFAGALEIGRESMTADNDFFLDLGGDSVSAVAVVVSLRQRARFAMLADVAVRDVYESRSAAKLAELLADRHRRMPERQGRTAGPGQDVAPPLDQAASTRLSPAVLTLAQLSWLGLELIVGSGLAYLAAFSLLPRLASLLGPVGTVLVLPVLALFFTLGYLVSTVAWSVVVKRAFIGRYRPIRVAVWSAYYLRHWIVAHTASHIPWTLVEGTVAYGMILRLLGARVGQRVHFHRHVDLRSGGWDLLTIGDNVSLAQEAAPRLATLEDGQLVVGPITLEDDVTLEVRAGMAPGSAISNGGALGALAWLPGGARVGPGERWDGVPAAPAGRTADRPQITGGKEPWSRRELSPLMHGALMIGAQSLRLVAETLPYALAMGVVVALRPAAAAALAAWLGGGEAGGPGGASGWASWLPWLILPGVMLPLGLLVQALGLRAMGRIEPGVYDRWGLDWMRVWIKSGTVEAAGTWLSGSLLWPVWLRLAGMRIGRGGEVSTIIDVVPETVEIGDESFFADGIYFCSPVVDRGTVTVAKTRLGESTFLGNHAVVTAGPDYPAGMFVGVATVVGRGQARDGAGSATAWFGQPPMPLPRREVVVADRSLTHEPSTARYWTRVFWELLRFGLPVLPLLLVAFWFEGASYGRAQLGNLGFFVAWLPALTALTLAGECAAVLALKWLLLGRVKQGQHPFWSCWCGRWDFVYMAWGLWARPLLAQLEGTLLLNGLLRLAGATIGRRVVLGNGFAQVVDPDMLTIEDEATVLCQFQAHSFEDRVLKIDRLVIRRGATVGPSAVVFYGADVGEGAVVAPHSVVMKREVLPAGGRYVGNPAYLSSS